jgi:hypothetical protein
MRDVGGKFTETTPKQFNMKITLLTIILIGLFTSCNNGQQKENHKENTPSEQFNKMSERQKRRHQYIDELHINLNKLYHKNELFKDEGKMFLWIGKAFSIYPIRDNTLSFNANEIEPIDISYQNEGNLPRGQKGYFYKLSFDTKILPISTLKSKIEAFGENDYNVQFDNWYIHRLDKNQIPNLLLDNFIEDKTGIESSLSLTPSQDSLGNFGSLRIYIELSDNYFNKMLESK